MTFSEVRIPWPARHVLLSACLLVLVVFDVHAEDARRELPAANTPTELMTRGKLEGDLGRFADAASSFGRLADDLTASRALRYEALIRRGVVLRQAGRFEESVVAFERVVSEHGEVPEATRMLVEVLVGVAPHPDHWPVQDGVSFERAGTVAEPRLHVLWPEFEDAEVAPQWVGLQRLGLGTLPGPGSGAPVSFEFKDASLSDLVRLFGDMTGMTMIADPAVSDRSVTMKLNDTPWDECLDLILRTQGLAGHAHEGIIRVGSVQVLDARSAIDTGLSVPFSDEDVHTHMSAVSLPQALVSLAGVAGMDIRLSPEIREDVSVTLALTGLKADQTLDLVMRMHGLKGSLEGDVLTVSPVAAVTLAAGEVLPPMLRISRKDVLETSLVVEGRSRGGARMRCHVDGAPSSEFVAAADGSFRVEIPRSAASTMQVEIAAESEDGTWSRHTWLAQLGD